MKEYKEEEVQKALTIAQNVCQQHLSRVHTRLDVEAIHSGARYGALVALQRFDPTAGCALSTWVFHHVLFAIKLELRNQDHLTRRSRQRLKSRQTDGQEEQEWEKAPISLSEPVGEDGSEETLEDRIADPSACVETAVVGKLHEEWLFGLIDQLPRPDRDLLLLKYWNAATPIELSRALQITKKKVAVIEVRAESRLRRLLEIEAFV